MSCKIKVVTHMLDQKPEENALKIPKNLILFWHDKNKIPDRIDKAIQKTIEINKDYNVIFADDDYMVDFIGQKYDSGISYLYRSIKVPSTRSDIARYMLLYEYGGVYLDAAMETRKSINTILDQGIDMVFVRRDDIPKYSQCRERAHIIAGIIGAIPKSEFLYEVISIVIDNLKFRKYNHTWYASSAYTLNILFRRYQKKYRITTRYFSDLEKNFFVYRRVKGISNAWVEQQKDGLVSESYLY